MPESTRSNKRTKRSLLPNKRRLEYELTLSKLWPSRKRCTSIAWCEKILGYSQVSCTIKQSVHTVLILTKGLMKQNKMNSLSICQTSPSCFIFFSGVRRFLLALIYTADGLSLKQQAKCIWTEAEYNTEEQRNCC